MKISIRLIIGIVLLSLVYTSCASKKRKSKEPSALGKFYHNTTAQYNGYFNANEIIKETYLKLEAAHRDDYTDILPLYDYVNVADASMVSGELDRAIEKVTTVALIHEPSHWVDDCYVLMGHAQYLKKDFESSEETFTYFKEEFDPTNPFGRNYTKKKVSKKAIKKEREKERKEAKKAKEQEKKEKEKEREQKKKDREAEKKQQKRDREAARKEREKEKKQRAKSKKKKTRRKSGGKKKRPPKEKKAEPKEDATPKIEPVETVKKDPEPQPDDAKPAVAEDDPRAIDEDELSDEESKKEKEKKKKKDKTAYSAGKMWLAKAYVQRDKLSAAKYLIRRMQAEGGLPDDVVRELPVIMADIYIKERRYEEALPYLDEAIELANKKKNKARYAYVAGQLSEQVSKQTDASQYFADAKRWSKDFKMEFMAELNGEKNRLGAGGSSKAVIAKLEKMTKERKYADYLDQLYYTMADIQLENNDFASALTSYRQSIRNNVDNQPLKVETYYKLATLFYEKEDYVDAKYHYDSTLQVISKEDSRYNETKRLSENLTDIARNISIIDLQDSLLAMAKLDDTEIRKIAEKLVEEGQEAKQQSGPTTQRKSSLLTNNSGVFGKSSFWAYDPQMKQRHASDFKDVWGDISLQDDWRRSDSQEIYANDDDGSANADSLSGEEQKLAAVNAMMTDIKKQLPYSAKQKTEVFKMLSMALFDLGKLYREKLDNFPKAVETHETLLSRFPSTDKKLDALYYLYLSNLEMPDMPRAEYYKDRIVAEYPDTEYAKVISDPAYAQSLLNKDKKLEEYYKETYAYFTNGDYQKAYNQSKDSESKFGKDNPLRAKFSLLNAMSLGSIKGKDVYVKALREIIGKYPNTPEKARAEEIMRFLQGDASAFDVTDMKEVDDIFSVEDNLKHYIAIVLYEVAGENLELAKIAVSEYNKKNFKDERLQLSDSNLNREEKKEIILVRKFKNKEESMAYYKTVVAAGDDFIPSKLGGYSIYSITQRNYRKLVIERNDNRYRIFFNKYYLGKE